MEEWVSVGMNVLCSLIITLIIQEGGNVVHVAKGGQGLREGWMRYVVMENEGRKE